MTCAMCKQPAPQHVGVQFPWMSNQIPLCDACQRNTRALVSAGFQGLTDVGVRPETIRRGYQLTRAASSIGRGVRELLQAFK